MKLRNVVLIFLFIPALLAVSCGMRNAKVTGQPADSTAVQSGKEMKKLPLPDVPSYIEAEQDRSEYILLHYWDEANLADSTWITQADIVEEGFAMFVALAQRNDDKKVAREAVCKMMQGAESNPGVYDMVIGLADKYLYDPNSPLRNDELYIAVLESQIANPALEDIYKVAPRERLKMSLKNRVGERANDFSYTTSTGAKGTLYGVKADYLLLFFYDLGCPTCREIREELMEIVSSGVLQEMMNSGRLKILAVYPDPEMEEWDHYVNDIPKEWVNAYDGHQDINNNQLYNLQAVPSLYLLDKTKKVLVKDFVDPVILYDTVVAGENR